MLSRSCQVLALSAALLAAPIAFAQSFTLDQALSAPFCTDLTGAPAAGRFAWVANIGGRRNIWTSTPSGSGYTSSQLTHYDKDDGQEISAITWLPDASGIIYVRGSAAQGEGHPVPNPNFDPMGAKQQIWIVSLSGGSPSLISEGSGPSLSRDGKTLAFTLHGQVYTVPVDLAGAGAKPKQILQTRGSAANINWSPDGSQIAFVSNRGDHAFIAVYNFAANTIHYLDPSTDDVRNPVWSPDGKSIAFVQSPVEKDTLFFGPHREGLPWSIRIADAATGVGRELFHADEGPGSLYHQTDNVTQHLYWSSSNLVLFPWERDGWLHYYAVPATGGKPQLLTPGDFEVEHVTISPDHSKFIFDSDAHPKDPLDFDRHHLWQIDLSHANNIAAPTQLTAGEGIEVEPAVTSDGTIAAMRSDAHTPVHPAVVNNGKLTDLAPQAVPADFPGAQFVTPKQVIISAADGMKIHCQLFLPKNLKPGVKNPAIVFFHGGSMRQMLLGFHYMEYYSNAYAMNQYLVSQGYIVLSVNYRSGIGYGLNFREAVNFGATGASEYNDVIGAGLYLRSRDDVDGSRIGVWGGSYGGYLTALALARSSDLFAAGVDYEGVHNWNTELPVFSPYFDPARMTEAARTAYESSPIASVNTWHSPVFLVDDDDDRNVPFAQTEELVNALRKHHVYFEEMIFPDEVHDLLRHRDWVDSYKASADFFERKLKNKTSQQ